MVTQCRLKLNEPVLRISFAVMHFSPPASTSWIDQADGPRGVFSSLDTSSCLAKAPVVLLSTVAPARCSQAPHRARMYALPTSP